MTPEDKFASLTNPEQIASAQAATDDRGRRFYETDVVYRHHLEQRRFALAAETEKQQQADATGAAKVAAFVEEFTGRVQPGVQAAAAPSFAIDAPTLERLNGAAQEVGIPANALSSILDAVREPVVDEDWTEAPFRLFDFDITPPPGLAINRMQLYPALRAARAANLSQAAVDRLLAAYATNGG